MLLRSLRLRLTRPCGGKDENADAGDGKDPEEPSTWRCQPLLRPSTVLLRCVTQEPQEVARSGNLTKVYSRRSSDAKCAGVSACFARRYWTQRTNTVHVPIWEPWYAARHPLAFVEPFAGKFVPLPEIANEESS